MRRTKAVFDTEVDARGLHCPLPVLRLARSLSGRPIGTIALLRATDPASFEDVAVFCREGPHRLIDWYREEDEFSFLVEKGR